MNRYRLIEALTKITLWISAIIVFLLDATGLIDKLSGSLKVIIRTIGSSMIIIAAFFMPSKMAYRKLEKGLKWLDKDNDKAARYLGEYLDSGMLTDIERRNGLRILGVAQHKRGDDEEAVRCLKEALDGQYKDNDLKVEILGAMGMIYSESGEYQKAVEHFDRTFEIIFEMSRAHIDKAALILAFNTYIKAGKKEKAIMIYDRLLMLQGFKRDKKIEELLNI